MVKFICKKATTIFSPYDIRLDEDSHSSTTTRLPTSVKRIAVPKPFYTKSF